jgi:membrane fusion protein (multidrug efflux system)
MANTITQPESNERRKTFEERRKTEGGVKPAPPKVTEPPDEVKKDDKPAKAEKDNKPEKAEADKYSGLKRTGKLFIYVLIGVAALLVVKYKFFTPPTVAVAQVRQENYTGELQGTGTINVAVLASVGAKVSGRIERMLVDEGDVVHAGQVIATLEDTDMRQLLESSKGRAEAARATDYQTGRAWEREQHLLATGAVSQEEADQYQERQRTAASAVAAAEADVRLRQFNLSQTRIFTYVSGIVTDRPKRSGDSIGSGEPVIKVADPKVILVEAYLDQRFAGDVRIGQTATVTLRGREKEPIAGRVYRIRPQADPAAEEMTVEITFPLPSAELQIGQWADVYVAISQTNGALVVPKTAVTTMGDNRFVLVADAHNKVRQVKVESVATSPRSQVMAVKGDLNPGDWVLTEPMEIKAGQKVRQNRNAKAGSKTAGLTMGSSPVMKM